MKYKVKCLQRNIYFWDGHIFDDKEDIHSALIDFHSIDTEGVENESLEEICDNYEWEIEELDIPDEAIIVEAGGEGFQKYVDKYGFEISEETPVGYELEDEIHLFEGIKHKN